MKTQEFWAQFSGLKHSSILVVGKGYVREDIKNRILDLNGSVTSEAVFSELDWIKSIVAQSSSNSSPIRMLGKRSRIELLKSIYSTLKGRDDFSIWNVKKRRPKFFEQLDDHLQRGRKLFAHRLESRVLSERLDEALGKSPHRHLYFVLHSAWEQFLESTDFYDEARLYQVATQKIQEALPCFDRPVVYLKHELHTPREAYFWEEVKRLGSLQIIHHNSDELQGDERIHESPQNILIYRAHSFEDALHFCFDEIKKGTSAGLVIEDLPEIRRSVLRMAQQNKISWHDPRDPTLLRTDESFKNDYLEFEMVARAFPLALVLRWLDFQTAAPADVDAPLCREILIQQAYQRDLVFFGTAEQTQKITPWFEKLQQIKVRWQLEDYKTQRLNLQEVQECFLAQERVRESTFYSFWKKLFENWKSELEWVSAEHVRKPLRVWFEEFQEEIYSAKPPVLPYKNLNGLGLYRVDQAVSLQLQSLVQDETKPKPKLHFFGISENFFTGREWGNDWLSQREIEVLGKEFDLPTLEVIQEDREKKFQRWLTQGHCTPVLWTFDYGMSGNENQDSSLLLAASEYFAPEVHLLGVYPKLAQAYSGQLQTVPREAKWDIPLSSTWSMTKLHQYSECPFKAFAATLEAYDEKEVSHEIRGDVYGNLLHSSLELWVKKLHQGECEHDSPQELDSKARQVFQEVWAETPKNSWMPSPRIQRSIETKMVALLLNFKKMDEEYRAQSKAHYYKLEKEQELLLKRGDYLFKGRADRIDLHEDGFMIFDYKTQSVLPNGLDIVEQGNGLQLGTYALAVQESLGQKTDARVIGSAYIQFKNKKAVRNTGIFFESWNGKNSTSPLSKLRSNSQSLFKEAPEKVWEKIEEHLKKNVQKIDQKDASAKPTAPENCDQCRWQLLCGESRRKLMNPPIHEGEELPE